MSSSWQRLCRATGLSVDGAYVDVRFREGRRHVVGVEETETAYLLRAVVVRRRRLDDLTADQVDVPVEIWLRNRATALVGFRIDRRGFLVGEAWVPKVGLTAAEFQLYVRAVAAESDRFEYALTGRDVE
jgi:hypothetical protein